jgi:hypothetical protein
MRVKNDIESRNMQKDHQKEMKRINSHQQNELESTKNKHSKEKINLKAIQQDELHLQRINHDNKVAMKSIENEKTYNKLQENLDNVKERISKTKSELNKSNELETNSLKALHDVRTAKSSQDNSLKMAEANDVTTSEINRIRRRYNSEKESLKNQSSNETALISADHKNQKAISKDEFANRYNKLQDGNARALFKIKVDHSKVKASEERKNLKEINQRREIYGNEVAKINENGLLAKKTREADFEKDYQIQYKKHEDLAKTLMKNKEKIVKKFTDELTQTFTLGAEKKNDDFYKFGKLDIDISENVENDGYVISIPVGEHEADKVKLAGEGREIRVTMEREYSDKLSGDGETDKMSKIETFTAKRSVEDLVDAKTVTKSYEDGNLIFKIFKA